MSKTAEVILKAASESRKASVAGWGVFGFLIPPLALIVVFCRHPRMDALALARHEDESTLRIYEAEYVRALRRRQVNAVLIWGGISFFIGLLFVAGAGA